jgi:hypothetical protein
MAADDLVRRVEVLEQKVEALTRLPERVSALELQIVQLRGEIRSEFSALRGGYEGSLASLRDEIRSDFSVLRGGYEGSLASLRDEIRDEIRAGDEETRRVLREEIRAGDEETRRFMRVLHEEVISRIAMIAPPKRPKKR